jgi:FkbM family methyltransferase
VYNNQLSTYEKFWQFCLMRVRPAPLASLLKDMINIGRSVIETPGGTFWIDPISNLGRTLTRDGAYEAGMHQTLGKYLFEGATFVDLGANEGYFTVIGGKLCGLAGRVLAIEPQQRLLPVIAENLRLNGVTAEVLNVAVTDVAGPVQIHLSADIASGGSGLQQSTRYRVPTQIVKATTLAQVLDDAALRHVDLLKVDIEGSEYEALLGSPEVFSQHRVGAVALELHPSRLEKRGKKGADITDMLSSSGYVKVNPFGNDVWIAPS